MKSSFRINLDISPANGHQTGNTFYHELHGNEEIETICETCDRPFKMEFDDLLKFAKTDGFTLESSIVCSRCASLRKAREQA